MEESLLSFYVYKESGDIYVDDLYQISSTGGDKKKLAN